MAELDTWKERENLKNAKKAIKEFKKEYRRDMEDIARMQGRCHDLAKQLSHYLYFFFFSFLFLFITTRWSVGKYHMTLSQCHNWCDGWSCHSHSVSHD